MNDWSQRIYCAWRIHRGSYEVFVKCPKCNREMGLRNHTIDERTGALSPSFMCPFDKIDKSCDFHNMVYLRQWWERSCAEQG